MAFLTDEHRGTEPPVSGALGLLACQRPAGRGTDLDVLDEGAGSLVTVGVSATPDHPAAELLCAGVRVVWQRIDLRGDQPRCTVAAVGHRRPVRHPVRLATALALAARGVPTLVASSPAFAATPSAGVR